MFHQVLHWFCAVFLLVSIGCVMDRGGVDYYSPEEARRILKGEDTHGCGYDMSHAPFHPVPPEYWALCKLGLYGNIDDLPLVEPYLHHENPHFRLKARTAMFLIVQRELEAQNRGLWNSGGIPSAARKKR